MEEQPALELNSNVKNPDKAEEQEEQPLVAENTTDYFLQELVNLANHDIEIGVTLTVGGFLLSGTIVGGKRYFDEHLAGSGFSDEVQENVRENMRKFFRSFGQIYDPLPEGEEARRPPTFIHLRDARFFHHAGKPIPGNQAIWWRGRISEVQGFSLGNLSNDSPS